MRRCRLFTGFYSRHQFAWSMQALICLAVSLWLSASAAAQYPYRPQYGNPYRPGISAQPGFPTQPQPVVGRFAGEGANDPNHISRKDFRNPSLELLKELGEIKVTGMPDEYQAFPRLTGEFESQQAILFSISDLMYQHYHVLKQLVAKTSQRTPIIVLVNNPGQLKTALEIAESADVDLSHVSFLQLKLDTIWLRDFGPRFVETAAGAKTLDFLYDGTRPSDDRFPSTWARRTRDKNQDVSWTLQGGNLLSNGQGLAITSTRLFEDNYIRFPQPTPGMNVEYERRKIVVEGFKQDCNIDRMVFLHPLSPESTKHVDMFATFLAPDLIVVAAVDPRSDPANARTLDQNAALLKTLTVDGKPMRVERIQIPPRQDKYWSPYTNVILGNELLLMPVYDSDPPALVSAALATYRRLLPGYHVDTIDLTSMQKLEGALHCMSINVPQFADLPQDLISVERARQRIGGSSAVAKQRPGSGKSRSSQQVSASPPPTLTKPTPTPKAESNQEAGQPRADRSNNSANASSSIDSQRKAALSYRRTFRVPTGGFQLDAVAIALSNDRVYLMRADNRQIVQVNLSRLSPEDRFWLNQNADKIRNNGRLVQQFFSQHPIKD